MPIIIKCLRRQGIYRAGAFHHPEPVEHPDGAFTPAQLAMLKAERLLSVEIVPAKESVTTRPGGKKQGAAPPEKPPVTIDEAP